MDRNSIAVAKEYIRLRPDYKEALTEIKMNLLSMGISEDEFNVALSEYLAEKKRYRDMANAIKPLAKNMLLFVPSILFLCTTLFLVYIYLSSPKTRQTTIFTRAQELVGQNLPQQQTGENIPPVNSTTPSKVVYATENKVNAQAVFSYPAVNNGTFPITGKPKKSIIGFLPYWMYSKWTDINFDFLTTLNLFSIAFDGGGNIIVTGSDGQANGGWSMWNDPELDKLLTTLTQKRVNKVLTITCFNNDDITSLAENTAAQQKLISNVVYMMNAKNLDGINVDFEYTGTPPSTVTTGFTGFIEKLSSSLKQQFPQSSLTVDTYLTSADNASIFDLPSIAATSDAVIVMGYDVHTPSGSPGPVAPLTGDVSVTNAITSYLGHVPANKLVLAIPEYGYDWDTSMPDNNQTTTYAQAEAESTKSNVLWDDASQTPWFSYNDGGHNHVVYFDNVRSLGLKYDLVNQKNLQGIGIWALGYNGLDTDLQQLLVEKFAH